MIEQNATPQYGGGFIGFFKGSQSLAAAFWLLGVAPAVIALFIVSIVNQFTYLSFAKLMLLTFALTIPFRLLGWFTIFRCIKNTKNAIWSFLVAVILVLDILHKLVFWPMVWYGYRDSEARKAEYTQNIDLCKNTISQLSGIEKQEIRAESSASYDENSERYYKLYYIQRNVGIERYRCRVSAGIAKVVKQP